MKNWLFSLLFWSNTNERFWEYKKATTKLLTLQLLVSRCPMIIKLTAVLALIVCFLSSASLDVLDAEEVIDAVPAEINTEPAVVFDQDRTGNEAVSYEGAQLWRIDYTEQGYRNAVSELQKQFQVSMWNLQMSNATHHVDLFVKRAMVSDARSFLENVRVPFDVVIPDVQDAINNENPSLDEVELWQNRNGEFTEPATAPNDLILRRLLNANFPTHEVFRGVFMLVN